MVTTIQVSEELVEALRARKIVSKETYEEVIWDLIEDSLELSEETKRHLKQAQQDVKEGKTFSLESVEKELGL